MLREPMLGEAFKATENVPAQSRNQKNAGLQKFLANAYLWQQALPR